MKYLLFGGNSTGQIFYENFKDKLDYMGVIDKKIELFTSKFNNLPLYSDISQVPRDILNVGNTILIMSSSIEQANQIKSFLKEYLKGFNIKILSIFESSLYPEFIKIIDRESRVNFFKEKNGNITYRLDYRDLTKDSIVVDLGGYVGQWASDIYAKYNCEVLIFEPVPKYSEFIKSRFALNEKIRVFEYGLATTQSTSEIYLNGDATTLFRESNNLSIKVKFESYSQFMESNDLLCVDLIKINIEGGEYELLEGIIANGDLNRFRNIQIQFHDFVRDAEIRRENIHRYLSETHSLIYNYDFVWESWTIK